MRLIPYLGFQGNCREAFEFYAKALGGKYVGEPMTFGQTPMAEDCPPQMLDQIVHVQLDIGGAMLMGADAPPDSTVQNNGTTINIDVDTIEDAERIFAALSDGAKIDNAMAETFWAQRWGSLTDRYGKPWMVNCSKTM